MKLRNYNRVLSLILCVFLFSASVHAQLALGPQRLVPVPAPTLRNRTRLSVGIPRTGRPRLGFVGRVGGVAFDSTAEPARGVVVNTLQLRYSPLRKDGERLSVTINGQTVSVPIYDWQLIPIAKFANSGFYSCFTLFGELKDPEEQKRVLARRGRILNYHPSFVNTLMGLRLFQLDSLIINKYSYDLVRGPAGYVKGEGESDPDIDANKKGLQAFLRYQEQNKELFDKGASYVISDRGRQVTFDLQDNQLNLYGEPSYYFWQMDKEALLRLRNGEAAKQVTNQLLAQIQELRQVNLSVSPREWLIQQLLDEIQKYDEEIGNYRFLAVFNQPQLVELLSTKGATAQSTLAARKAMLNQQPPESLLKQLAMLRILADVQQGSPVPELSENVSARTTMLRAINPAVWDAGVALMRYAAFFRYCEQQNPQRWNLFMRQIKYAPLLRPAVTTPTIMEPPSQ